MARKRGKKGPSSPEARAKRNARMKLCDECRKVSGELRHEMYATPRLCDACHAPYVRIRAEVYTEKIGLPGRPRGPRGYGPC